MEGWRATLLEAPAKNQEQYIRRIKGEQNEQGHY